MFFKEDALKKFNKSMYFVFVLIGGITVAAAWFIPDVTMKVFFMSALFAILLAMTSVIISRAFNEKNSEKNNEINRKLDILLEKFEVNKPEIVEIKQPEFDTKELPHILKEYEIVIKTQMHFNDLIMKVRTTTLSVVLAVFGAAGYSFASENISSLTLNGLGTFHPAALIVGSGIFILFAVFIVDYKYYYKMLLGAVKQGYEFDKEFQKLEGKIGRRYFGMSTKIQNEIGTSGTSKRYVKLFYMIPMIGGIVFLLVVLIGYQVPSV